MFYACPPSNAFPWGMSSKPTPVINTVFTGSESTTFIPVSPNLTCPRLKELTVVCNDSTSTLQSEILDDQFPEYIPEEGGEEDTEPREPSTTEETRNSVEASAGLLDVEMNTNKFPSLARLTLFASTPAQALAALDVEEAAWDVGSDFQIDVCGLRRNITSTAGPENPFETEGGTQSEEFHTVVLRPKARWNERWESLRDVARRQREANVEKGKNDDDAKSASETELEVFVLKPGEQL
ncbi:hypothetical protein GG344DRAFT_62997 [Lentinula edodes]|nr:hypothetical protein GG344DRAFT_62997 [Lentinula edodes]